MGVGPATRAILLTHIHLDHAGATGCVLDRWPEVEVWVHERGVRHLVDPTGLLSGATAVYGAAMDQLWGPVPPVPAGRIRVLSGGEQLDGFRVAVTPSHAPRRPSYFHERTRTAFAGDVGGVRVGAGPALPPTPPPDIDFGEWDRSLDTVAAWNPARLALAHYGLHGDPAPHLAELRQVLRD